MPDFRELQALLARIEALADGSPDWGRTHLADLLNDFRPRLSAAALRADSVDFIGALHGLHAMVKRYVMTTSL